MVYNDELYVFGGWSGDVGTADDTIYKFSLEYGWSEFSEKLSIARYIYVYYEYTRILLLA